MATIIYSIFIEQERHGKKNNLLVILTYINIWISYSRPEANNPPSKPMPTHQHGEQTPNKVTGPTRFPACDLKPHRKPEIGHLESTTPYNTMDHPSAKTLKTTATTVGLWPTQ